MVRYTAIIFICFVISASGCGNNETPVENATATPGVEQPSATKQEPVIEIEKENEQPLTPEQEKIWNEFVELVKLWETVRTGKKEKSDFPSFPFRELVEQIGKHKIKKAVPYLLHIFNNDIEHGWNADFCVKALIEIADKRAYIPLLEGLCGSSGQIRAIDALSILNKNEPVSEQILLALNGDNEIHKRRALRVVRNILDYQAEKISQGKLTQELKELFAISEPVKDAIIDLLKDKNPIVRFEALETHYLLNGEYTKEAAAQLKDEKNISVRELFENRTLVKNREGSWLVIKAALIHKKLMNPDPADFKNKSAWSEINENLSLRVSTCMKKIVLNEPLYGMNQPVWIRLELRNNSDKPVDVHVAGHNNLPTRHIFMRDAYGKGQPIGPSMRERDDCVEREKIFQTIKPGETLSWMFNILRYFEFTYNGEYTLHLDGQEDSAKLLTLSIEGLPDILWLNTYPGMGYNPTKIYFPKFDIPTKPMVRAAQKKKVLLPEQAKEAPKDKPKVKELFAELLEEGKTDALLGLTHYLSVDEISKRLKAMPCNIEAAWKKRTILYPENAAKNDESFFGALRMGVDSTGVLHVVFCESHIIPKPDYLGNGRRWKNNIFYLNRTNGKWSQTELLYDSDISIGNMRLLVDKDDTLHLLIYGHNETPEPTASDLKPGINDILLMSKSKTGKWSKPESCITYKPEILHGFDACLDKQGNLHLVWAPWIKNKELDETIHHRIRTKDGWQKENILPQVENSDMTHPYIRMVGEHLHVFAAGQTKDYSKISPYHYLYGANGWSNPIKLVDNHVNFDLYLSSEQSPFLFATWVQEKDEPVSLLFFNPDKSGNQKQGIKFTFPKRFDDYYRAMPVVASDGNGTTYALIAESGYLYLLRQGKNDNTEAIYLDGPSMENQQFLVIGNRLYALWVSSSAEKDNNICFYEGIIPEKGWQSLNTLTWKLRRGFGLSDRDRSFLEDEVIQEAKNEKNIQKAIERCFYKLENFGIIGYSDELEDLLVSFHEKGEKEVIQQLWSRVENNPKVFERCFRLLNLLDQSIIHPVEKH